MGLATVGMISAAHGALDIVDCPVWTYKSPCPSGRPPDSDLDHAARVAHAHDLQNDDIMCALALTYVADVDDIL